MSADLNESSQYDDSSKTFLEQIVNGSRKTSNYIVAVMLPIGGVGLLDLNMTLLHIPNHPMKNFIIFIVHYFIMNLK